MTYTFLLYYNEAGLEQVPAEQQAKTQAAFTAYTQDLKEAGLLVAADWLAPTRSATTITKRNGGRQVQDGPFAETKEQLGGYFAIRAKDLDEALAWAEKCPAVWFGSVEVRPSMMA